MREDQGDVGESESGDSIAERERGIEGESLSMKLKTKMVTKLVFGGLFYCNLG